MWAPLTTGGSLAGAYSSMGFPSVDSLVAAGGQPASPEFSPWAAEESQTWSTSFSSFSTDLGINRVVPLPYSHSALLWLQFHLHNNLYFFLLKYVIMEMLPPFLIGPALASNTSILELPGIGSAGHGGILHQLHTQAVSVVPLLPKPGHANPIQAHTKDRWY